MLANTKDTERCGSGILDVKALDVLEGLDGESLCSKTPSFDTSLSPRSPIPYSVTSATRRFLEA